MPLTLHHTSVRRERTLYTKILRMRLCSGTNSKSISQTEVQVISLSIRFEYVTEWQPRPSSAHLFTTQVVTTHKQVTKRWLDKIQHSNILVPFSRLVMWPFLDSCISCWSYILSNELRKDRCRCWIERNIWGCCNSQFYGICPEALSKTPKFLSWYSVPGWDHIGWDAFPLQ
jgi:hypothetical protein